jgi:uncharacterized membrane protein YqjE
MGATDRPTDRPTDRSIGTVLTDIVRDVQQIVRAETRLARAEFREELAKAKRGATFLVAAGVVCALALGLALLAAVYALTLIWPPWAAALAVAGATFVIGGVLAAAGLQQLKNVTASPDRTVSSLKENIQWAKTRIE